VKLYEIVLKPESRFGTPLKGDTLFGHFIWQLILSGHNLPVSLESYVTHPFIIFSSAFPKFFAKGKELFFLTRPALPLNFFQNQEQSSNVAETIKNRKKQKKKKYLQVGRDLKVFCQADLLCSEKDIVSRYREVIPEADGYPAKIEVEDFQLHNKINRLTGTTGEGFAPYNQIDLFYLPGMELSLFVLVDESVLKIELVLELLEQIGLAGFGRDASSGMGRFSLGEEQELELPDFSNCEAIYTLSPCVPEKNFLKCYFQPFVRFGKHGSFLATSENPFKNPVLMVDEGAVFITETQQEFPFIGRALQNLSKTEPQTIGQGYSIVLPLYFKSMEN